MFMFTLYSSTKHNHQFLPRTFEIQMSTSLILAGIGLATAGYAGRYIARKSPQIISQAEQTMKSIPNLASSEAWANSKYYKGGFDGKMTKREASLILGVSPNASQKKIRESHKRIMLLNHPDRGGSPYLAAKINEKYQKLL